MSDESLFQRMDEEERIYAPEELPVSQQDRVLAEEGARQVSADGEPIPKPLAASDNLLFGFETDTTVVDDAEPEGSDEPRILPPLPIRAGPGLGQTP